MAADNTGPLGTPGRPRSLAAEAAQRVCKAAGTSGHPGQIFAPVSRVGSFHLGNIPTLWKSGKLGKVYLKKLVNVIRASMIRNHKEGLFDGETVERPFFIGKGVSVMKSDKWPAVTIKLKPELAEQIKRVAEEEGIPHTTLCRVIIRNFVRSRLAAPEPAQS